MGVMKDFIAIDFETANAQRSSICSVGLVFVEGGEIVDTFHSLILPSPNYYSKFNTRIHGLDFSDTCFEDKFPEVWSRIVPKLNGAPLVAHNSPFDEGCLRAVHSSYGMSYPEYKFLCTLKAARRQLPQLSSHRLPMVAAHCGYNLENHHDALADAIACAAIAVKLL